ncbi:MAG: Ig-like domain-containing protein [Clostridia bacterium]|nr:Ig-like domain-containing protein [Clostridia bacterium]
MRKTARNFFAKLAVIALSAIFAAGFAFTAKTVRADEVDTTETADITVNTVAPLTYQGQDNWYYLTGDFSEGELYRMYYNQPRGWWQGQGNIANFITGEFNSMFPLGADVIKAYVVPEFGKIDLYGRVLKVNATDKIIDVKVVHRSANGNAVLFEDDLSEISEDGVFMDDVTITANAGDVLFFVAETNETLAAWDGVTFDAGLKLTKRTGKGEGASLLNAAAMPLTGGHATTVTEDCVDYHPILTESMKLTQTITASGRQIYGYRGTDGNFAWFDFDANGGDAPYRLAGMNYDGCSTGINAYRVFYSNNGWTGASGMMYYAPSAGYVTLIGRVVIGNTADIIVSDEGQVTVVKTLTAGEYDLSTVTEANEIAVGENAFVAIMFDGPAWTVSSLAGVYDFYIEPSVATETIVPVTEIEISADGIEDGTITLEEDETAMLVATIIPEGAEGEIEWTSSDETVATVGNGEITAHKAGTTTVTAALKDNAEIFATVTVTVTEKQKEYPGASSSEYADSEDNSNEESTPTESDADSETSVSCMGDIGAAAAFGAVLTLVGACIIKSKKD